MGHQTQDPAASRRAMRRAFSGPRMKTDAERRWHTMSRQVDGRISRAMRREVARPIGKKTKRLGAAARVSA